jgi:Mlc titration factor MtfA (ptsG expression regulator)
MPEYYVNLLSFIGGLILLMLLWMFYRWRKRQKIVREIERTPLPDTYRDVLKKIPHYNRLSDNDRLRIERSVRLFIRSKEYIGNGIEITDEIRVVIAFYACLLLLHIETANCYDTLKTIIVYPHAMVTEQLRANSGIYSKEKMILSGQSANDTVVISWHDAKKEAYHLRHENVVIHEFAHEIDFMDGEVDGVPPLELSKYNEWSRVMYDEFRKLNTVALRNRDWGKYKMIGAYAASNEAEFFAVITERFFESPHALKHHFPDLYKELSSFYKIDPILFEPPEID